MSEAGYLQLVVDSTSVAEGERALDSIARTGGRVEGQLKINMGGIEQAMARLGQQIGRLDSTMTAQMQKAVGANQKQTRSFEELRAAIDPTYALSQKYAAVQQELARMVQTGEASQRAANVVLEQAASRYMGVATASERAEQAQRDQARATVQSKAAYEALRASVDPVYAASKRYEAAIETLDAAQKAGVVTDRERAKTLSLIEAQMIGTATVTGKLTTATKGLFASVGGGQMALRQTAFQLNQIAQQGAVTGNYMQAASIQSADLLTVFGLWGILAGGVIAVTGPLIMSMFDLGNEAKEAEKAFERLDASVDQLKSTAQIALAPLSELRKEYGAQAEEVRALHKALIGVYQQQAVNNLDASIAAAAETASGLHEAVENFSDARRALLQEVDKQGFAEMLKGDLDAFEKDVAEASAVIQGEFGLTTAQAYRIRDALVAVDTAASDGAAGAAKQLAYAIGSAVDEGAELPSVFVELATKAATVVERAAQIETTTANVEAGLYNAADAAKELAAAIAAAAGFSVNLENQISVLDAQIAAAAAKQDVALAGRIEGLRIKAREERDSLVRAGQEVSIAEAQYAQNLELIEGIKDRTVQLKVATDANKAAGRASKAASTSTLAALQLEIADRQTLLSLTGQERREFEAILAIQKRLGKEAGKVSAAQIEGLADQLLALEDQEAALQRITDLQGQWSEQITRTAFENGSLGDTVKGVLKDIAFQFANTKVVLPVVASVTGILGLDQFLLGGNLSTAVASGGGGGGLLGGLLGNAGSNLLGLGGGGGFLSGIGSGLGGVLSGGGIGSSFANLGGLVTGASSGLGAIGAALPALGIIAGVGVLLSKALSREYAGTALRGTLGTDGFSGTSFDFYKGGALRSDKANYKDAPAELVAYLDAAMMGVTDSISTYADALSLDIGDALQRTGEEFTVWLNGKSQEEIIEALNSQVQAVADEMAELVLGTDEFTRSGESALDTLTRLGSSLLAVNDTMLLLGRNAFAASLSAANVASMVVDQFGGIDAMNTAISTYWQAFYTEAERNEGVMRQLVAAYDRLNVSMPQSRAAYRALIEAQDLNTERGRELYAQLVQLAAGMDQVLPTVESMSFAMMGIVNNIGGEIGGMIDIAQENAKIAEATARLWYRTAETLRDFIRGLTNSNLSPNSPAQRLGINRARYGTAFEMVQQGDIDAAKDLPELAKNLLESELAGAKSAAEYNAIAAKIQQQLLLASGIADLEGANEDVLAALYEQQIDVLTALANFLQLEGLTDEAIGNLDQSIQDLVGDWDGTLENFEGALGSLEQAIIDASGFSYEQLKEKLKITVELLPQANIPEYLKNLIAQADTGLTSYIDFIVRSELPAPEKWLAINAASEHIKTLEFVLGSDLDNQSKWLALQATSELEKNVKLILAQDLDPESRLIALAGNSELSRLVNVALGIADPVAMNLALANIKDYAITIEAALSPSVSEDIRRVILEGSGGYAAMIEASLTNLTGDARRILLAQQGVYVSNITAVIAQDMPEAVQRLILNANTNAIRGITIAMAFPEALSEEERTLLLDTSTTALRTIQAVVNPNGITPLGSLFLMQLADAGYIERGIQARMWQADWSLNDQRFLDQLSGGYGYIERGIQARMWQAGWSGTDAMFLGQLVTGGGYVARGIESRMWQAGWTGLDADILAQLGAGSGFVARGINAQMWQSNWTGTDNAFLNQLMFGSGAIARGIEGRLWQTNWTPTDANFLGQLVAGNGQIQRIIDGSINLGSLNASQIALLNSITGSTQGTITLAGTYRFEPEEAFQSWYRDTTQAYIQNPMASLRGALIELRDVMTAEAAARDHAQRVNALENYAANLGTNADGNQYVSDAQILEMAQIAGINTAGKGLDQIRYLIEQFDTTDSIFRMFRDQSGAVFQNYLKNFALANNLPIDPAGYLQAYPDVARSQLYHDKPLEHYLEWGKAEIATGKRQFDRRAYDWDGTGINLPAYAMGTGFAAGGMSLVGERGPELVNLPRGSQVYTNARTREMMDMRPVARELAELRAEIARLRDENRQLGLATVKNTKTTADVMRKADKLGMPVRNPDEGTALEVS